MLSIDNTYSLDDLQQYGAADGQAAAGEPIEWVVELKVDGVAVSLIYEDGLLMRGVTRGNGRVGDDMTHNIRTIRDVPLRLLRRCTCPPVLEVRGEVYMTNSDLVRLNERQQDAGRAAVRQHAQRDGRQHPAARSRGSAPSGGCGSSATASATAKGCRRPTHMEFLARCSEYGLPATPHVRVLLPNFDAAVDHCEELIERLHELDFEIDGLVLKVNRFDQRERLGATSKSPRWVIAYKFEKYEATTRLNDDPRAGGQDRGDHARWPNWSRSSWPARPSAGPACTTPTRSSARTSASGDVVVVEKAGKIIPHIVRVEKHERAGPARPSSVFPRTAPNATPSWSRTKGASTSAAPIRQCPAQVKERIRYFASRNAMDIEGLGRQTGRSTGRRGLVTGLRRPLPADAGAAGGRWNGWGKKSAENLLEAIAGQQGPRAGPAA